MLTSGRYYVGDLCYVLNDETWDDFCNITTAGGNCLDGEFKLSDGRVVASYSTMYGDGCYRDNKGNSYSVDAGLIGCILLSEIDNPDGVEDGVVIDFNNDFETSSVDGVIRFGKNIVIDTSFEEVDTYDEEEFEYE